MYKLKKYKKNIEYELNINITIAYENMLRQKKKYRKLFKENKQVKKFCIYIRMVVYLAATLLKKRASISALWGLTAPIASGCLFTKKSQKPHARRAFPV